MTDNTGKISNEQVDGIVRGIFEIEKRLMLVEVKGDSVEQLFSSRVLLKQLLQEIEKIRPLTKSEEEDVV